MKIAFIGLGDMGSQMVPHLISDDNTVVVWDKEPAKRTQFLNQSGVTVASSLQDAVSEAELVITAVMFYDVLPLHVGDDLHPGIVKFLQPNSILVITSTLNPDKITAINAAMPAETYLIDAPMNGGVSYARDGTLTFMAGGDASTIKLITPVLNRMGKTRFEGPLGTGAKLKLISNVLIMAAEAGIRESLDLADAYEIDYQTVIDLLKVGPMAAVINRALNVDDPRPLKDSVHDVDELLAAGEPLVPLDITQAAQKRLWAAVNDDPQQARFIDITTKATKLPQFRTEL
ncbi:NAD(P)-dependent oxidoreductase [Furfurilactobacillus entadae]|uniref:NAD(P)-dependent oxidoreductase n=1 Tax=Furfurilactobacillus entadae TaxID=2922307 RepID=UPI0035EACBF1